MFDLRKIKPIHMWVLGVSGGLVACTETSPILEILSGEDTRVNIVKLERLPELLYSPLPSPQIVIISELCLQKIIWN
ncbi:MAG: hypothetical protein CM1200mP35_03750 [Chloroflexota bacterium]|nr:MAG: hypothetical protein CM1200mP35_03750 [Chloroflexota bacterium]